MAYGGGHGAGTGRRATTEFPAAWSREEITDRIVDVAKYPDEPPRDTLLAEVAVRRGDPDAADRLAEIARQADGTGEPQRITPVLELEVEYALTRGLPPPVERVERALALAAETGGIGWGGGRLAGWASVAGVPAILRGPAPTPHAAMAEGDWRGAADRFGEVGWHHDRALMLALLDDGAALGEAMTLASSAGATPLAEHLARRMRERGLAVPHERRDPR